VGLFSQTSSTGAEHQSEKRSLTSWFCDAFDFLIRHYSQAARADWLESPPLSSDRTAPVTRSETADRDQIVFRTLQTSFRAHR
jgi:hypothetical protein